MELNDLVINSLITRDDYIRNVLPFLKEDYFTEPEDLCIYKIVNTYFDSYNEAPSSAALSIELGKLDGLSQSIFNDAKEKIDNISEITDKLDYLVDTTEKYCQDKALYNAINQVVDVLEDEETEHVGNISKHAIPDILKDALAISFDDKIGHDYTDEWEPRYEYYNKKDVKLPFDIDFLNELTDEGNGIMGLTPKTLTAIIGVSGSGKSLAMTHFSSRWLVAGKNVLYITLEMSEYMISKRIDCNLMDITTKELLSLSKDQYKKKMMNISSKTPGKLKIKEYPTGGAHAGHFKHLINELDIKQNFRPDVICIDYLGICASSRIKNSNANTYSIQKSIAEEFRALAIEFDVPVITAVQSNRNSFGSSDMSMADVSDSIGVAFAFDLFFAIITDDTLRSNNQVIFKSLKNRFGEIEVSSLVGIDYTKMRFYNIDNSASNNVHSNVETNDLGSRNTKEKLKKFDFE